MNPRLLAFLSLLVSVFAMPGAVRAQQPGTPSDTELAAITARGRALAAYDQAVWHASDALQMANPRTAEGQRCLARLENDRWRVVFGKLNADGTKFLITYEATEGDKPQAFKVTQNEPPKQEQGFYLFAARATEIALADFGRPPRPYNAAVLPASEGQFYVYLYPAQLKARVYPLGGDVRYVFSADGEKILEKRPLHNTVIETPPGKGKKAGFHTHVLSDLPEDTDVLHVLQQDPRIPETVSGPRLVYEVTADGSIRIRQEKMK